MGIKQIQVLAKWCRPVIPVFGRLRQEDPKFMASKGSIARSCLGKKGEETQIFWENHKTISMCLEERFYIMDFFFLKQGFSM